MFSRETEVHQLRANAARAAIELGEGQRSRFQLMGVEPGISLSSGVSRGAMAAQVNQGRHLRRNRPGRPVLGIVGSSVHRNCPKQSRR